MKQIFLASSLFELVCAAAGIDSGAYSRRTLPAVLREPEATPTPEPFEPNERILLVSNNAQVLEQVTPLTQVAGVLPLLDRFDRVVHLNDLVAPQHPSSWSPEERDLPMLQRLIRRAWDLDDEEVELVLESPQVNPAIALGRVFADAEIRVHADGLMSFGPTRNKIPLSLGQRMTSLHYLPLVEGLQPHLLNEFSIAPEPLARSAFVAVVDEVTAELSPELDMLLDGTDGNSSAFAVGQYLSALGLIEHREEEQLHRSMFEEASRAGCSTLVFKPHPAAPVAAVGPLRTAAAEFGIDLRIIETPIIAEVILHYLRPRITIGTFSTALATARAIYGVETVTVGTEQILRRIAPYQNSNRIPLTIMDWLSGRSEALAGSEVQELQSLIDSVAYCMQPDISSPLRGEAADFLSLHSGTASMKYFKRRRLEMLSLPGGTSRGRSPKSVARRIGGVALRVSRQQVKERLSRKAATR